MKMNSEEMTRDTHTAVASCVWFQLQDLKKKKKPRKAEDRKTKKSKHNPQAIG